MTWAVKPDPDAKFKEFAKEIREKVTALEERVQELEHDNASLEQALKQTQDRLTLRESWGKPPMGQYVPPPSYPSYLYPTWGTSGEAFAIPPGKVVSIYSEPYVGWSSTVEMPDVEALKDDADKEEWKAKMRGIWRGAWKKPA